MDNINLGRNSTPVRDGNASSKNKWIALILCYFVGVWGIHRFYVGKTGTGILYILTLSFCGLGWLLDMISIVRGTFKDKQGKCLTGPDF